MSAIKEELHEQIIAGQQGAAESSSIEANPVFANGQLTGAEIMQVCMLANWQNKYSGSPEIGWTKLSYLVAILREIREIPPTIDLSDYVPKNPWEPEVDPVELEENYKTYKEAFKSVLDVVLKYSDVITL